MSLKTSIIWEVQQKSHTANGPEWLNLCTVTVENMTKPLQFPSFQEAKDELDHLIQEHEAETQEPFPHSDYRIAELVAYDPAPLYAAGYRFKMRVSGAVQSVILTYRFHNGEGWRYHLGLDLGPDSQPMPEHPNYPRGGTCAGRHYVDFTTIDEFQVKGQRIPSEGEPPMYIVARGFGMWVEYWNTQLGWVNRAFAQAFSAQDVGSVVESLVADGARSEVIK